MADVYDPFEFDARTFKSWDSFSSTPVLNLLRILSNREIPYHALQLKFLIQVLRDWSLIGVSLKTWRTRVHGPESFMQNWIKPGIKMSPIQGNVQDRNSTPTLQQCIVQITMPMFAQDDLNPDAGRRLSWSWTSDTRLWSPTRPLTASSRWRQSSWTSRRSTTTTTRTLQSWCSTSTTATEGAVENVEGKLLSAFGGLFFLQQKQRWEPSLAERLSQMSQGDFFQLASAWRDTL